MTRWPPRRAIFLDDDPDLRAVFADLMTEFGVPVIVVENVGELERAMSVPDGAFDLAILDLNLGPGAPSGLDALRWLRAHGFEGRVVVLTGYGQSDPLVTEAQRLGDVAVHKKPITLVELRAMLT